MDILNNKKQILNKILIEEIENTKKTTKKSDLWNEKSPFYGLKLLSIDERGRNAQNFILTVFKNLGYSVLDNDKINNEWDIKIKNYRIEVKGALIDRSKKFQHESVRKSDVYDFIFFVDIALDKIFFGCCKYSNIPFEFLHERGRSNRPTGSGYKWDINPYSMKSKLKPIYYKEVCFDYEIKDIFEKCENDRLSTEEIFLNLNK